MRTSPALGRLLCALALGAQLLLPAAHGWEVSRAEASHPHESWAAGVYRLAQDGPRRHHHHDEEACAVCPVLSRLGGVPASSEPVLVHPPKSLGVAVLVAPSNLTSSDLDAFLSRGPPAT